jgi:hypothetical protein
MKLLPNIPLLFSLLLIYSCASVKPYYAEISRGIPSGQNASDAERSYSLYLVGGVSLRNNSTVLKAIENDSKTNKSGLILLGDVLSIDDLPSGSLEDKSLASEELDHIKNLDAAFKELFLIPGQKEWTSEKTLSFSAINSLDHLLKDVLKKGRFIEPRKGCGSPEVVRVTKNTIVVLVDSQWAIESESYDGEKMPGCDLANVLELKLAIKDIIQSHPTDHIIIATHHPIYANGTTAGNYPLASHLLPVPVLGTLITGVKSLLGSDQHFGHPAYEAYRAAIISALDGCKNCVVVSGHEKNLQYYQRAGQHYFVAGSGDQIGYARKGEKSEFSYMSRGYIRADVMNNGSLQVSFYAVDELGSTHPVFNVAFPSYQEQTNSTGDVKSDANPIFRDSILMQASARYSKKPFLGGGAYRKAWSEKIKLPVLWLDKVHGGLTPLQLGGGHQTRSLRMENPAGEQYVLRSIDKSVSAVLPPALRGTFAENIIQEGIASSHPYGSLVIPRLAHAAGIYYSTPSIVYVPRQAALGIYNDDIGDGVYLFEERAGGNTSGFVNFGNTKETFTTLDVIDLVAESHKNKVDERAALRARLFDIWVGDWDRHDDQVRWGVFKENDISVYRPIPRDRDQVFYKNDGLLNYLGSRPYFYPALRMFREKIDYLPGLVWAGKWFDRSFLHELTEEDFVAEAKNMQSHLTDEVIDAAFLDWPQKIDSLDGASIRRMLRIRRDHLVEDAHEYYRHLSKVVAIPGTNDQDIFTISSTDDHHITITVDRTSGNGTLYPFYQRTFNDDVTKELQLFGLDKDDVFRIEGEGNPSICIRLVGGSGDDQSINNSVHLHPIAYDVTEGMDFSGKPLTKRLNNKPLNNTYDRTDWKLNKSFQFPSPTYYTDEGVGLSYTLLMTRFGFRSNPFKSRHTLNISYFFNNESFIGKYKGEWLHVFGDLDLGLDAFVTGPTYTQYFYGLGNKYVNYPDFGEKKKYHIVKGNQLRLSPSLVRRFGFGNRVFLAPSYQYIDIEDSHNEPRFIYDTISHLTPTDFGSRHYLGLTAGYQFDRLDNESYPNRGINLAVSFGGRTSLSGPSITHELLSLEGALYIPFDVNATFVLATHVQVDKIFGEYEFFHAVTLGGPDKLRGFRRDRFAGNSRVYQSTDLRIKLFQARGMIPLSLGVYGSFDYGRVWYEADDASADQWHTAVGGGVFIVPLGLTAFRLGYMKGKEDHQLNIGGSLKF